MVKIYEGTKDEFYMDGYLAKNLEPLKDSVKKDWDVVICVDGGEGSGKSVLAQQIAKFFDPSFTVDRMTIGLEQFEEAILTAKPGMAVVGDEMMRLLNSRSAMTQVNKRIVELLAECRQKNLFIILVMPSFFDMDKYGALWRTTALVHVYTGENMQRGFFAFFGQKKKKMLYLLGKKFYDYKPVKPDFIGRFTSAYVIDEGAYRKKKAYTLRRDRDQNPPSKYQKWLVNLLMYGKKDFGWTVKDMADAARMSDRTAFRLLKGEKEEGAENETPKGASLSSKLENRPVLEKEGGEGSDRDNKVIFVREGVQFAPN